MVGCIFRKRRIKSKTGCPEVDLLTEFHCTSRGGPTRTPANVRLFFLYVINNFLSFVALC